MLLLREVPLWGQPSTDSFFAGFFPVGFSPDESCTETECQVMPSILSRRF
jgi:hypothetical protein